MRKNKNGCESMDYRSFSASESGKTGQSGITAQLAGDYIRVSDGETVSTGGSQLWLDGMLKRCGCSVIAAADTLMYIEGRAQGQISADAYKRLIGRIKKYFPLIPFRGMPGFAMPVFFSVLCRRRKNGYTASWGCFPKRIAQTVTGQLENDIPVPFCVGAGFHRIFKKQPERGLRLYEKRVEYNGKPADSVKDTAVSEGKVSYIWTRSVRNHFMVMTGVEGDWASVSSWGRKYYISLRELESYSLGDGFGMFTNIIRIRKAGRSQ